MLAFSFGLPLSILFRGLVRPNVPPCGSGMAQGGLWCVPAHSSHVFLCLVLSSQILTVSLPLVRTMTHPIAVVLEIQALPEAQVGGDQRRKDPTFKSIAVTGCQDMGR